MKDKPKSFRKELKQPDVFETLLGRVIGYVEQRRRQVFMGLAGAALVLIVVVGTVMFLGKREDAAQGLLAQAQTLLREESTAPGGSAGFEDESGTSQGLSGAREKGFAILRETIDKYGRTHAAQTARLFLGQVYYQQAAFAEATQIYQDFLRGKRQPAELNALALEGLAYACEASGNLAEARTAYEKLTRLQAGQAQAWALMGLGRICEKLGQTDQALEAYRKMLAEHPNHPKATEAKANVSRLSASFVKASHPLPAGSSAGPSAAPDGGSPAGAGESPRGESR